MSQKERKRLVVMEQVKATQLTLAKAAEVMRVCYRQAKRIWRRYVKVGDGGLVHKSRGRPSGRRTPAKVRAKVLVRYAQRYPDFGPTLAAEKLAFAAPSIYLRLAAIGAMDRIMTGLKGVRTERC